MNPVTLSKQPETCKYNTNHAYTVDNVANANLTLCKQTLGSRIRLYSKSYHHDHLTQRKQHFYVGE